MKKIVFFLVGWFLSLNAFAENGVSTSEIILGQTAALTGPAEQLGNGMKAGLTACFDAVNEKGGVNGRKVRLVSLDDGYEPEKAIANTYELIQKEKVFMLIGAVGTPTANAVLPIIDQEKIPFFAPFTGAESLRTPFQKHVINIRGSYYQEMNAIAAYLTETRNMKNIACLYQNDSYGMAGLAGIENALKKKNMSLSAKGSYERNTIAIKSALMEIKRAEPEAVVMVGAYKPCAEFIKLAKKVGMKETLYCNISFVGTDALRKELGDAGDGVMISQVVRFPWDERVALVKEYQADMKKFQPAWPVGFVSLEGYMAGRLFLEALSAAKGDLSRQSFIDTIEKQGSFDIGGIPLSFSPEDHQGLDEIYLTVIKNGEIHQLEK
jgi:ABC-type branched-subunit amino acid transport system substrate-binding protein